LEKVRDVEEPQRKESDHVLARTLLPQSAIPLATPILMAGCGERVKDAEEARKRGLAHEHHHTCGARRTNHGYGVREKEEVEQQKRG
jgi:hypothetical protein